MQLYEEPPEARGVISFKGKILTERRPIPFLASMRLPSPSETAAQRKGSGGSSPYRWDNSRERIE